MWRYLKAAFWAGMDVRGMGHIPVNALGAAAFGILGFAEPALWLLGLGVEGAVLFALTTNTRFQKVVDARYLETTELDADTKRRALITTLPQELQRRLVDLNHTCQHVAELSQQADEFVAAANHDALQRLEWVYLKLLVARYNLTSSAATESERDLAARISALEASLHDSHSGETLRQSRLATLAIYRERLVNVTRRKETLDEIDSDLTRIEAQVQLMLENVTMQGKPATISTDIELASNLAGMNLYGESSVAIADLDEAYGAPGTVVAKAPPTAQ